MRDVLRNSYEFWREHFFVVCFLQLDYPALFLILERGGKATLNREPGLFFGRFILSLLLGAFFHAASLIYIGRNLEDQPTTVWEAFVASTGRVFPMIVTSFAIGIATVVGGILLIVPGIYILLTSFHTNYFVAVKGHSIVDSVKSSRLLMKGQHFFALKLSLAMAGFSLLIEGVIGGLGGFSVEEVLFKPSFIFLPLYAFVQVVMVVFYFYCQKERHQSGS
jgi:hypothetical protein